MAGTAPAGDEGEALLVVRRELHDQQARRRYRDAQHLQPHADILGVRSSLDLTLEHLAIGQLRPAFLCLTERSVRRVDERLDGAVQRRHAGGIRAVASAEPWPTLIRASGSNATHCWLGVQGRGYKKDGTLHNRSPVVQVWLYGKGATHGREGINKDGTQLAQQESSGTSMAKERDMEAKASKHASKCEGGKRAEVNQLRSVK